MEEDKEEKKVANENRQYRPLLYNFFIFIGYTTVIFILGRTNTWYTNREYAGAYLDITLIHAFINFMLGVRISLRYPLLSVMALLSFCVILPGGYLTHKYLFGGLKPDKYPETTKLIEMARQLVKDDSIRAARKNDSIVVNSMQHMLNQK